MSPSKSPWIMLCVIVAVSPSLVWAQDAGKKEKNLNDLSLEVAALEGFYEFKLTDPQLRQLREWAKETVQKPREREAAKANAEYREKLQEYWNSLVNEDDDLAEQLYEQLQEMREADKPELDDGVEITPRARKRVPELLRQLKPTQVGFYISDNFEDVPDPADRLIEALDKVRGLKGSSWKEKRDEFVDEISKLLAGIDADKAERVGDRILALLIQAHDLGAQEFARQRPELEKKARQIAGEVDPLQVLRNQVEIALAEMLSNPRLPAALEARLK